MLISKADARELVRIYTIHVYSTDLYYSSHWVWAAGGRHSRPTLGVSFSSQRTPSSQGTQTPAAGSPQAPVRKAEDVSRAAPASAIAGLGLFPKVSQRQAPLINDTCHWIQSWVLLHKIILQKTGHHLIFKSWKFSLYGTLSITALNLNQQKHKNLKGHQQCSTWMLLKIKKRNLTQTWL